MDFFGLDIGTSNIKIIQLKKENGQFGLLHAGVSKSPFPGINSDAEKDLIAVAETVKKLKKEAGITLFEAVTALPESKVFTRVVKLPTMREEEIANALKWELEEIVPIPLNEAIYDWQVVTKDSAEVEVLVAVSPKILVEKYLHIFQLADLKPIALETEVVALTRALKFLGVSKPKIILDFGANSINLIVTKDEGIMLTRSLPAGGRAITKSISTKLSLEENVAEEYKKTYGLTKDQFGEKIQEAILPVLELLFSEIKKSIEYVSEKKGEKVELIVLSGGGANLPEFSRFLTKEFGIEVQVADPFSQLKGTESLNGNMRELSPSFCIAVGLAMKEV